MTKLKASYVGFTFGFRVADQFALTVAPRIDANASAVGLHAIKGLVNVFVLEREIRAFGLNSVVCTEL